MNQNKARAAQKPSAPQKSLAACNAEEKLAVAVDPELKTAAVRRLRRIAGQIRHADRDFVRRQRAQEGRQLAYL